MKIEMRWKRMDGSECTNSGVKVISHKDGQWQLDTNEALVLQFREFRTVDGTMTVATQWQDVEIVGE